MEFQTGPRPVPEEYIKRVGQTFKSHKVVNFGGFDRSGRFQMVKSTERVGRDNRVSMWALELLAHSSGENGIISTNQGTLSVFQNRREMLRGNRSGLLETIDPTNTRFVHQRGSFRSTVGESGWVFSPDAAWSQRRDRLISPKDMGIILLYAEHGHKPPFFDDSDYIQVKPEHAGEIVEVIKFQGIKFPDIDDLVVVGEDGQLLRRSTQRLLSRARWEPEAVTQAQHRPRILSS